MTPLLNKLIFSDEDIDFDFCNYFGSYAFMRKTLIFQSGFIDLILHAIYVLLCKYTKKYFAKEMVEST